MPLDVITRKHRQIIVELAAKHRLPAIYFVRRFVQAGGLVSFGVPTSPDTLYYRRIVGYTDRVLRGTKVSDLPVQVERLRPCCLGGVSRLGLQMILPSWTPPQPWPPLHLRLAGHQGIPR